VRLDSSSTQTRLKLVSSSNQILAMAPANPRVRFKFYGCVLGREDVRKTRWCGTVAGCEIGPAGGIPAAPKNYRSVNDWDEVTRRGRQRLSPLRSLG
jgi:hypothetical protein